MMDRKLSVYNLPWSTDWDSIFGAHRPRTIVEIGFGNGDFLIHLAKLNPEAHVIGVEIANKSLERAEKKIRNQAIENACAVHGRAETFLYHVLETGTIDEFHINYPDPWFKSRHERRRLIKRDTVDVLTDRLKSGGTLNLATDILEYAEMSDELLCATQGLENTLQVPWADTMNGRITTKYEQKGLREGRPGKYFRYRRTAELLPPIPTLQELDMPHVIVKSPMTLEEIITAFDRPAFTSGDIHISILSAYLNLEHPVILFETTIEEPTIDQHLAFSLVPRKEGGKYIIRLNSIGQPRPTVGVHYAAGFLGDWVADLHPDAEVLERRIKLLN